jgi:hypothetical protein
MSAAVLLTQPLSGLRWKSPASTLLAPSLRLLASRFASARRWQISTSAFYFGNRIPRGLEVSVHSYC